jgi:hypothetical protein
MKAILKTVCVVCMAACVFVLSACGGSSNIGEDSDIVGSPTIETVGGTGIDGAVLDTLLVTGTNFDDSMDVYLVGPAETESLAFTLESPSKFTASLPSDIEPGDFELNVQNDLGKATAPLSLLQGEQGEAGISIEHYYACGLSGDFNADADVEVYGQKADIWEFSDGSYFISCQIDYLNTALIIVDTVFGVSFVPAAVADGMGELFCGAMYASTRYFPASNSVRYQLNTDTGQYADLSCSTVY